MAGWATLIPRRGIRPPIRSYRSVRSPSGGRVCLTPSILRHRSLAGRDHCLQVTVSRTGVLRQSVQAPSPPAFQVLDARPSKKLDASSCEQTGASKEVVGIVVDEKNRCVPPLRLLKERDQAREQLRADVQAGFDQFASGEGRTYDMISGRQLAGRIKSRGRTARTKKSQVSYRLPCRTGPRGDLVLRRRGCQSDHGRSTH
jgi:hypothetical protein